MLVTNIATSNTTSFHHLLTSSPASLNQMVISDSFYKSVYLVMLQLTVQRNTSIVLEDP